MKAIPKLQPRKIDRMEELGTKKFDFKSFERVNPHSLEYEVDPIQDKLIKKKMARNPEYALIMRTNETKLFFEWIHKKLKMRENILVECMGFVRSGKSVVAQSICKYISNLIGIPFTLNNICSNESEFARKVMEATKNKMIYRSIWSVDEQIELHTQSGSYAEMEFLQDLANITAIEEMTICWCHPEEFVGRNALVGLETYGRNFEYGINRCILYNLWGTNEPIGIVYIPRHRDFEFERKYEDMTKKPQVEGFLSQNFDIRTSMRYELALKLKNDKDFNDEEVTTIPQKMGIARKKIPFWLPESALKEIVQLAKLSDTKLESLIGESPEES